MSGLFNMAENKLLRFWKHLKEITTYQGTDSAPPLRDHVPRPIMPHQATSGFSWRNQNILFLGQDGEIFRLAKSLADSGAGVSFRSLAFLQDVYSLPLEQYSMIIMTSGFEGQDFDVVDVGGILRRADSDITLVWASELFKLSLVADATTNRFCDIQLALPTTPNHLENFMRPAKKAFAGQKYSSGK